jgi:hypothetical protein
MLFNGYSKTLECKLYFIMISNETKERLDSI